MAPASCARPAAADLLEMAESREKERQGGKSKVTVPSVCDDPENSEGRWRVGACESGSWQETRARGRERSQDSLQRCGQS